MNASHERDRGLLWWGLALLGLLLFLLWAVPCPAGTLDASIIGAPLLGPGCGLDAEGRVYVWHENQWKSAGAEHCTAKKIQLYREAIQEKKRKLHTPLLPGGFLWQERWERVEVPQDDTTRLGTSLPWCGGGAPPVPCEGEEQPPADDCPCVQSNAWGVVIDEACCQEQRGRRISGGQMARKAPGECQARLSAALELAWEYLKRSSTDSNPLWETSAHDMCRDGVIVFPGEDAVTKRLEVEKACAEERIATLEKKIALAEKRQRDFAQIQQVLVQCQGGQ